MPNGLEGSMSPYLRQHADDPVDWLPWGDDAFRRAAELDRPVLLSCGYSACHWCHVMQRESFRDAETAAVINDRFVAVKVDRELRPDVDALYQDYVAASSGAGGWPLTVWLTPRRLPLYGGTYFPHRALPGQIAFADALSGVAGAWSDDRADVERTAAEALSFLRSQAVQRPEGAVDRAVVDSAADRIVQLVDADEGGIGPAPKFPQLSAISFLCAYAAIVPDGSLLRAISATMRAIVRGGIFDQAGGGVHRYAVDATWRTPHFEKMLYDQGMLLSALAAAAPLATPEEIEEYARAARATATFLRREMALSDGGFAASLAAESGGVDGVFYTWSHDEIASVLSPDELRLAIERLGVDADPGSRRSTLHRPDGRGPDAGSVDAVLARLAAVRDARPHPERDGKLLTGWNAIAARGLIEAGTAFGDAGMVVEGVELARLLLERCSRDDGVVREPDDPTVAHVRLLEDAAHLVAALLSAHEATGEAALLEAAEELQYATLQRFSEGHVLFSTAADTDLPLRPRDGADDPVPSGTATTIENAVRLGKATGDAWFFAYARGALEQTWSIVDFAPHQAGRALSAALALEVASRA